MAEPLGVFAKIKLSTDAYKQYFKSTHIAQLTAELFDCVLHKKQDAYVYKYNKKEETLFFYAFYNHGNIETIQGGAFQSILEVSAYATLDTASYIVGTADGFNWQSIDVCFCLSEGSWTKGELDATVQDEVKAEAKRFFTQLDEPYYKGFEGSKTVDSNVNKKVYQLVEKHRLANLTTFVTEATTTNPVHLFGDYYYNGKVVFSCTDVCCSFPNLDLATLKLTAYGACDANHVVVKNRCIETDPANFKKIAKVGVYFFKSSNKVFDMHGYEVEGADVHSFNIINDELCEDAACYYYRGIRLQKEKVGVVTLNQINYQNSVLVGKDIVYFNSLVVNVDAASFVFDSVLTKILSTYNGFIGTDKDGVFVYLQMYTSQYVLRENFESVDHAKKIVEAKYGYKYYGWEEDARIWDELPREKFLKEFEYTQKTDSVFYQMKEVMRYVELCVENYTSEKDEAVLDGLWFIYTTVEPYFWLEPGIYFYLTVLYADLGKTHEAMACVRNAIEFGDTDLMRFFTDTRLVDLNKEPYLLELKNHVEQQGLHDQKPVLGIDSIEKILLLDKKINIGFNILVKYTIYDRKDLRRFALEYPEHKAYWQRFELLTQELFNRCFKTDRLIDYVYNPFADYEFMPLDGHLSILSYELKKATIFKESMAIVFTEIQAMIENIKSRLIAQKVDNEAKALFNANAVVQLFDEAL